MNLERLAGSRGCFVCGRKEENPMGLNLAIYWDPDGETTVIPFDPVQGWCGYEGVVHGGILAAIGDDAMAWAIRRQEGVWSVTARMETRYRRPVKMGQTYTARGRVLSRKGRRIETRAVLEDPDGNACVEYSGHFVVIYTPGGD